MSSIPSHNFYPLGDAALLVSFGNMIDEHINNAIVRLSIDLENTQQEWMIDVVPAYSSLAVFYDAISIKRILQENETAYHFVSKYVESKMKRLVFSSTGQVDIITIPVCYDHRLAPDLRFVSDHTHLSDQDVVKLHSSTIYRVYMNGFLPGFAYMGKVDARIAVYRKTNPVSVPAGSVAIAGVQTGIYPLNSPGGWQIIGRTPVSMFLPSQDPPIRLTVGNLVQFTPISYNEFESYQSRHPR